MSTRPAPPRMRHPSTIPQSYPPDVGVSNCGSWLVSTRWAQLACLRQGRRTGSGFGVDRGASAIESTRAPDLLNRRCYVGAREPRPMQCRIARTAAGERIAARMRSLPPHRGHSSTSAANTRCMSCDQESRRSRSASDSRSVSVAFSRARAGPGDR